MEKLKNFMDSNFNDISELLFRAVFPPETYSRFWKENGKISSAAFKDKHGLSVDRAGGRSKEEAIDFIKSHKSGCIVSVSVGDCNNAKAVVKYLPTRNIYHSEIHGSNESIILNDYQAKMLSRMAVVCSQPSKQ